MNWFVSHYLDIIALLLVLSGLSYGFKKGIVRIVIFIAGFAAAAFLAGFVSNVCGEYVYINFVKPSVLSVIEENISSVEKEYDPEEKIKTLLKEKDIVLTEEQEELVFRGKMPEGTDESDELYSLLTGEEFRGTLNSVFAEYCKKAAGSLSGVLPEEIAESAERYLSESGENIGDTFSFITGAKASAAEIIEEKIVRPLMIKTVKRVLFIAVFAVVTVVFALLSKAFGIVRRINMIKAADSFFGGLLGFVLGLLNTAVFSLICGIYINLSSGGGQYLCYDVISATYFFKYAYAGTFMIISLLFK